jgi:threonine synthase
MWSAHRRQLVSNPKPLTRATAIRIGSPANWPRAVRALEWTEGMTEAVTDEEISQAKTQLASDGVGCEPASAATAAGIRKLRQSGAIEKDADVVAVLTGHQLKDTDYILEQQSDPARTAVVDVGMDPAAIQSVLQSRLA